MAFKSSNDLRVEVRYQQGLMVPRVWRGDTEIQVKEMTQGEATLDFTADLGAEIQVPIAPLAADEAAAAALSDAEKERIHKEAVKAKLDASKGDVVAVPADVSAEPEKSTGK